MVYLCSNCYHCNNVTLPEYGLPVLEYHTNREWSICLCSNCNHIILTQWSPCAPTVKTSHYQSGLPVLENITLTKIGLPVFEQEFLYFKFSPLTSEDLTLLILDDLPWCNFSLSLSSRFFLPKKPELFKRLFPKLAELKFPRLSSASDSSLRDAFSPDTQTPSLSKKPPAIDCLRPRMISSKTESSKASFRLLERRPRAKGFLPVEDWFEVTLRDRPV